MKRASVAVYSNASLSVIRSDAAALAERDCESRSKADMLRYLGTVMEFIA